ncbi:MAG: transglycosylase SLT domain-containing protein [Alphaproteobacteria bacterium]|nr:transglycosylase SLT domain-containing protein [Alphaproteobacteria bacterium]
MHWGLEPRRLIAAAVLLSSVSAPAVADDPRPLTAAIVPGALEHDATLPKLLSDSDAATYRTIFRLQDHGNWIEADRNITRLKDRRLLGHVLAQRYLAPNYRSRFDELSAWLDRYADHPQAGRLFGLAMQRMPMGAKPPQAPIGAPAGSGPADTALAPAEDDNTEFADQPAPGLDLVELADSDLGGDEDVAQSTPAPAAKPASSGAGRAWAGGLAAWRSQRFTEAAKLFEQVGGAASVNPWVKAAGYYWAARAYHAGKQPQRHTEMLQQAAQHPRTFYGILARHVLGWDYGLNFQTLKLAAGDIDALAQQPRIQRAIALSQVWQFDRADHELRVAAANGGAGPSLTLVALAERIGTPASSLDLAQRLMREEGVAVDTALYPVMPWSAGAASENGIDAALVHALVRQESGFRPRAKSHAGARGLMQLMPATGKYMARETNTPLNSHERLFDPPTNLMLGQAYVGHLLRDEAIGSNLFKMTAAYNGGPGNLRKWERRSDHRDDPLLFIESIPSRETRVFIERVLANMWIYRIRFNQSIPSLDALAAGEWPGYDPQNSIGVAQAVDGD